MLNKLVNYRIKLINIDFGMDNRLGDAKELKYSRENSPILNGWLIFLSTLYDIPKSLMAQIKIMQYHLRKMMQTVIIVMALWLTKKTDELGKSHSQLNYYFQIAYNHIHLCQRKTPLYTMLGIFKEKHRAGRYL